MKNNERLEYLKQIITLESYYWACENLINSLNNRCLQLGAKKHIVSSPNYLDRGVAFKEGVKSGKKIPLIITAFIAIVFWGAIFATPISDWDYSVAPALLLSSIPLVIYILITGMRNVIANEKVKKNYLDYQNLVSQDNSRTNLENSKKLELQQNICEMRNNKQLLKSSLNSLYSRDIIYVKYRNLIAVAQFYDYFASGRCSTFEGSDGAYNLFENELRLNTIIYKMDNIIGKLDAIQNNQHMLYSELKSSRQTFEDVTRQLKCTNEQLNTLLINSYINSYNSMVIAKKVDADNYMKARMISR